MPTVDMETIEIHTFILYYETTFDVHWAGASTCDGLHAPHSFKTDGAGSGPDRLSRPFYADRRPWAQAIPWLLDPNGSWRPANEPVGILAAGIFGGSITIDGYPRL